MIRSRCSCESPPWSAAASRPRPESASARSSTSPRVRANTRVAAPSSRSRIRPSAASLSARRTTYATWRTRASSPFAWGVSWTRTRTGSFRWRSARRAIWPAMVAEKSAVWRSFLQRAEDLVQVVGEAHVEHLVGLVQDDGLDLVEAERAAIEVVHGPAGGGDDDVHAAGEAGELRGDRLAAVDRDDAHAEVLAVAVDRLRDLHRELPRGGEHERRRAAAAAVAGHAAAIDRGAGLAGLRPCGGPGAGGSAGRRRRSCRCRSGPPRAGRGPRAGAGSPPPGWAWAPRSRGRPGCAGAARRGRGWRSRRARGSGGRVGRRGRGRGRGIGGRGVGRGIGARVARGSGAGSGASSSGVIPEVWATSAGSAEAASGVSRCRFGCLGRLGVLFVHP